jgi:hypothetical protein
MPSELVKALLQLLATCLNAEDCGKCVLRDFCGKLPTDWC